MNGYKNSIVYQAKYGIASDGYWSSSQANASEARYQKLNDNGGRYDAPKGAKLRVRPVRAF